MRVKGQALVETAIAMLILVPLTMMIALGAHGYAEKTALEGAAAEAARYITSERGAVTAPEVASHVGDVYGDGFEVSLSSDVVVTSTEDFIGATASIKTHRVKVTVKRTVELIGGSLFLASNGSAYGGTELVSEAWSTWSEQVIS